MYNIHVILLKDQIKTERSKYCTLKLTVALIKFTPLQHIQQCYNKKNINMSGIGFHGR